MRRYFRAVPFYCWLLLGSCWPSAASAEATALAQAVSELDGLTKDFAAPALATVEPAPNAAQHLAAAELLVRTQDYQRALNELNQVLELQRQGKADGSVQADALFLLGESYFAEGQLLAARRQYAALLEGAPAQPFLGYAGRSAARLVDIAVRLEDLAALPAVQLKLTQLPADVIGSIDYARAKLHFARGNPREAVIAARRLSQRSKYYPQAQYLLGLIELQSASPDVSATKAAKPRTTSDPLPEPFSRAVPVFQRITQLKLQEPEHLHVVDLAWLALGRIFYETENYLDAADAYNRIKRTSPEYRAMLAELSWVYVRLGDYSRALPLLEMLELTEADTLARVEGALLRGDVLLRSKKYDAALEAYRVVRTRYEPLRAELASFVETHADAKAYYDRLLLGPEDVRQPGGVAASLLGWVHELAEGDRALSLIRDNGECRELLRSSFDLSAKITGTLASAGRSRAFPTEKAEIERWESLLNRVAAVRLWVARDLDEAIGGRNAGATAERRAMMHKIGQLPRSKEDFARRERDAQWQWLKLSHELQRATLDADRLQALVNGLTRLLAERSQPNQQLQGEVAGHASDIQIYQERIAEYRRAVEAGRLQNGLGDQRFVNDAELRTRFAALINAEVEAASLAGQAAALESLDILRSAAAAEQGLLAGKARTEAQLNLKASALQKTVSDETRRLTDYQAALAVVEEQARQLVSESAKGAFVAVRDRLTDLVQRSDSAVVQQAWEIREDAARRVVDLRRSRSLEEKQIKNELTEVLGDGNAL